MLNQIHLQRATLYKPEGPMLESIVKSDSSPTLMISENTRSSLESIVKSDSSPTIEDIKSKWL